MIYLVVNFLGKLLNMRPNSNDLCICWYQSTNCTSLYTTSTSLQTSRDCPGMQTSNKIFEKLYHLAKLLKTTSPFYLLSISQFCTVGILCLYNISTCEYIFTWNIQIGGKVKGLVVKMVELSKSLCIR